MLIGPTKEYESNAWLVLHKAHWSLIPFIKILSDVPDRNGKLHIFFSYIMLQPFWEQKKEHESQLLDTFILVRVYSNTLLKEKVYKVIFKCNLIHWKGKNTHKKLLEMQASNFQHLRFQKCSHSRNHLFFRMIQFQFFLSSFTGFLCQFTHFWCPCTISVHTDHKGCHLQVKRGITGYITSTDYCGTGVCRVQRKSYILFLSFFQEFTEIKQNKQTKTLK